MRADGSRFGMKQLVGQCCAVWILRQKCFVTSQSANLPRQTEFVFFVRFPNVSAVCESVRRWCHVTMTLQHSPVTTCAIHFTQR